MLRRGPRLQARGFSQYFTLQTDTAKAKISLVKAPGFVGHATDRMMRPYNEDRYFTGVLDLPDIHGEHIPVFNFSIFDGHGGSDCAEFLAQKLALYVESADLNSGPDLFRTYAKDIGGYWRAWKTILARYSRSLERSHYDDMVLRLPLAYLKADLDYIHKEKLMGSTCTSAYIYSLESGKNFWDRNVHGLLTVAQVGDTRAILGDNRGNAMALSTVHHPSNPHESDRLRNFSTGIFRTPSGEERFLQYANTRAFGDFQGKAHGISAEPDISTFEINGERQLLPGEYAFLILVSDGVTDKASDQELVDLVIQSAHSGGSLRGTPQSAAQDIVSYVEMLGTKDNATALIVRLGGWGNWVGWTDRSGSAREERLREDIYRRRS